MLALAFTALTVLLGSIDQDTRVDERLAATARAVVVGVVRDTTDRPIQGVWTSTRAIDTAGAYQPDARTDRRGAYQLVGLAPGRHLVTLRAIGYTRWIDTLIVKAGHVDTVGFVLKVDPTITAARDAQRLERDTAQPALRFTTVEVEHPRRCYGVDSVLVSREHLVVTGFKGNANMADGVTSHVFRRGSGIVLDLFDAISDQIMPVATCTRWRATITRLPRAEYHLTVRQANDPRDGALTWLILSRRVDMRRPTAMAVGDEDTIW